MNSPSPTDMPVVSYDFHRSREAVDRGAVIIALMVAIVAGVATAQSIDSIAIGLVIGSTLFALLAPLFATAAR
ncbi:MAG: hypothetical protein Q7J32_15190 [Sphingomonadaceae bacterium]|nr:hypothetical protein [Sphingomonadaceae bacterium]